eukprot:scaffold32258_cov61-Cyclotella_meneghiniana.AAC.1
MMNRDDSDDKENSNRGNAMMAMDVDDDGNGKATNSNCLIAAALARFSKNTPTRQELQLWNDVANRIDKNENVNSSKLFDAISCTSDAIRYCKDPPTCNEARSFFDNYVPKIVSILLYELEDGMLPEVKPRIKTLLGEVLEVVSRDLMISAQLKQKCETLTIITRDTKETQ